MDLNNIVRELKSERDRLARAIAALLDQAAAVVSPGRGRGRGRGKGLTAAGRRRLSMAMKRRWSEGRIKRATTKAPAPKRRGGLTPAGRKKLSEAMKRRWADRKKAAAS